MKTQKLHLDFEFDIFEPGEFARPKSPFKSGMEDKAYKVARCCESYYGESPTVFFEGEQYGSDSEQFYLCDADGNRIPGEER